MSTTDSKFTRFKMDISSILLPEKFTFPFYYEPHTLARVAAKELQKYIINQTDWSHDFGDTNDNISLSIGKMFGVLVVRDESGELGYLSAFSGKLAKSNHHKKFVPPVYDMLEDGDWFNNGMQALAELQKTVKGLSEDPKYQKLQSKAKKDKVRGTEEIQALKHQNKLAKADRKRQRIEARLSMDAQGYKVLIEKLAKESQSARLKLKLITSKWVDVYEKNDLELLPYLSNLKNAKKKRAEHSAKLQQRLFESYRFLNGEAESKSLIDIFIDRLPVAGAGECAAPKLLQHAYLHRYQPICMAEFWWGKPPKSAIRKHGQYYPACRSKCLPILGHMLLGIDVDENPLFVNPAIDKVLEILYEDEQLIAVNKPEGMLSVPGVHIEDSVTQRIMKMYPDLRGPWVVHRLDMSTSGVMILSKTKEANQSLQEQFAQRSVNKTYVALLDGYLKSDHGEISLPIRLDLDDRPKQLVDHQQGKVAVTNYEVIEKKSGRTRIHFYPVTGRTHQLRVHAAHHEGLNHPIVGDYFYGAKSDRLYLHAERLEVTHPTTNQRMTFHAPVPF